MKSADEIVRALQNYASDCGADEACFQCTVAWMCDELGGNAPKIIANTVERLQSKLAAYEDTGLSPDEIPRWIPVSERLPKKSGHYLVISKMNWAHGGNWEDDSGDIRRHMAIAFFDRVVKFNVPYVTHWQPLPAAPKEEK